jgi:transcriptional regulator with XRE-family HTH domain
MIKPVDIETQIGQAIRQLRQERQLTLTELGDLTHLSPGHLSQIERGQADPSLNALRAIAAALGIPLTKLLLAGEDATIDQDEFVCRKSDRTSGRYPGTKVKFQLIEIPSSSVQLLWVTAPPGAGVEPHKRKSPGEECALVLSGKMQVFLDNAQVLLESGDAVFIQAYTVLHGWKNAGDEELVAVWVATPRF